MSFSLRRNNVNQLLLYWCEMPIMAFSHFKASCGTFETVIWVYLAVFLLIYYIKFFKAIKYIYYIFIFSLSCNYSNHDLSQTNFNWIVQVLIWLKSRRIYDSGEMSAFCTTFLPRKNRFIYIINNKKLFIVSTEKFIVKRNFCLFLTHSTTSIGHIWI